MSIPSLYVYKYVDTLFYRFRHFFINTYISFYHFRHFENLFKKKIMYFVKMKCIFWKRNTRTSYTVLHILFELFYCLFFMLQIVHVFHLCYIIMNHDLITILAPSVKSDCLFYLWGHLYYLIFPVYSLIKHFYFYY